MKYLIWISFDILLRYTEEYVKTKNGVFVQPPPAFSLIECKDFLKTALIEGFLLYLQRNNNVL